jgi:hypothetical protein
MGPLLVEDADELIEPSLLLQEVFGRRLSGFLLQREIHALMAAILVGMARLDAFDVDPEPQPPDRKLGESEERVWIARTTQPSGREVQNFGIRLPMPNGAGGLQTGAQNRLCE